jgi:hypothetical protein
MTDGPIEAQREIPALANTKIALLDPDRLHEVLSYDPDTGVFRWRVRLSPRGGPGERAGALTAQGYRRIGIDGVQYFEHQLAWLMHYGEPATIDHKNLIKNDNRIANLRPATSSQNAMNRAARTPFKGVKFQYGRYHASIRTGKAGERLYLGSFATGEEAHAAYRNKAVELHGEFMRIKMNTFETRQQLHAWATDKPEPVRNHVWVLCAQLWTLDKHDTPIMRGIVAKSMERLHELKAA